MKFIETENTPKTNLNPLVLKRWMLSLMLLLIGVVCFGQKKDFKVAILTKNKQLIHTYDKFSIELQAKIDEETNAFIPSTDLIPIYKVQGGKIELEFNWSDRKNPREIEIEYSTSGTALEAKNKEKKKLKEGDKLSIPLKNIDVGGVSIKITSFTKGRNYTEDVYFPNHSAINFNFKVVSFNQSINAAKNDVLSGVKLNANFSNFHNSFFNKASGIGEIRRFLNSYKTNTEQKFQSVQQAAKSTSSLTNLQGLSEFINPKLKNYKLTRQYTTKAKQILNEIEQKEWTIVSQSNDKSQVLDFQNKFKKIRLYTPIIPANEIKKIVDGINRGVEVEDKTTKCAALMKRAEKRKPSAGNKSKFDSYYKECLDLGCSDCSSIKEKVDKSNTYYECSDLLTIAEKEKDYEHKKSLLERVKDQCSRNDYGKKAIELLRQFKFSIKEEKELEEKMDSIGKKFWIKRITFKNGKGVEMLIDAKSSENFVPNIISIWEKQDEILDIIIYEFKKPNYELFFVSNNSDKSKKILLSKEKFKATLAQSDETITINIETNGRAPYFLQFENKEEDKFFAIRTDLDNTSNSVTIQKANLENTFDGVFKVNLVDNYGNLGLKNSEVVTLEGKKTTSLWMFLVGPTLLLSGFLFYRNLGLNRNS